MELRVLRYFLTIAREGSITNAANVLHVTQPTLSRQIHDLEEELGQRLFVRGSRNMSLTAEGMILRKRAEEIISMVDKTEAEFHSMSNVVSGDIYIGGGETEAVKLIAQIVCELRTAYPEIHYHLYSGNAEDVTERLDKGLLDWDIDPACRHIQIRLHQYSCQRYMGRHHAKRQPPGQKRNDQKRRSAERSFDLLTSGHFRRAAQE